MICQLGPDSAFNRLGGALAILANHVSPRKVIAISLRNANDSNVLDSWNSDDHGLELDRWYLVSFILD